MAVSVKTPSPSGRDGAKTWRQQQADGTRARIAESARRLFATHGYSATSIDAIAREGGVGVRTVYAVFGTKREILSDICEAWLDRAHARQSAADVLAEPDAKRRLERAAEWLADLYGAGFDVLLIFESASGDSEETRELLRAKLAGRDHVMDRFIVSLKAELSVPVAEAKSMYRALAAPGVYHELVERGGWDRDRFATWVAETMARHILR